MPCPKNACQGGYGKCLDVKLTNACNCHCNFCIEKGGLCPPEADARTMAMAAIQEEDYKTVLVLGGEPMHDMDRLMEFLKLVRPWKDKVYMTTNGCYLSPETACLVGPLLDGINVSVHHYNQALAREVLRQKDDDPHQLSFIRLAKAVPILKANNCPVRLNVNLVGGGFLHTRDDVEKMLGVAHEWGVDSIRFTELQDVDDGLFTDALLAFPELAWVDPWNDGCEQKVPFSSYPDLDVTVKLACGHVNPRRPRPAESTRCPCTKVLYPDGIVRDGWVKAGTTSYKTGHSADGKPMCVADPDPMSCHPRATPSMTGCH